MSSTPSDNAKLDGFAEDLIRGLAELVPGWVERTLGERLGEPDVDIAVLDGDMVETLDRVSDLLRTDIDQQSSNPLAVIRSLVVPMTQFLAERSVEDVVRDPDAQRIFPEDRFDLAPGSFSDIHPDLHVPGLSWGAAKAHIHLQRRRAEGMLT